eukprot:jgi/Mesvir1/27338/Mv07153-RA.1
MRSMGDGTAVSLRLSAPLPGARRLMPRVTRWVDSRSVRLLWAVAIHLILGLASAVVAGETCPCEVCPCYCPCVDRSTLRVAFVIHQPVDGATSGTAGMLRLAGARQAAWDRNLQLKVFYPRGDLSFQLVEALEFLWNAAQGSVDAIVTTFPYEEFMAPLQAANDLGIPVYLLGGTSRAMMSQLRAAVPGFARGINSGAGLLNVGLNEELTRTGIVDRLMTAGIRHLVCLQHSPRNLIYASRCAGLQARFLFRNLTAETEDTVPSLVPLRVALAQVERSLSSATRRVNPNETAIILFDMVMYRLAREILAPDHPLAAALLVTYESSPVVLADLRAGMPVVLVRQSYYSQAYTAVALAAYELQTGQMLPADVRAVPDFRSSVLASEAVSDADVDNEHCRSHGYPVCGAPGVPAEPSPGGCSCFDRSTVRMRVLSSLLPIRETFHYVKQGLLDAVRDLPGSSYEWMVSAANASVAEILSAINATRSSTRWSSVLSLDYCYGVMHPEVTDALQTLGASKGNRTFWVGADRNERTAIAEFLSTYSADGYVGPGNLTWAGLGSLARELAGAVKGGDGSPSDALLFAALHRLPPWDQRAEGFIQGYLNTSAPFPDGFWQLPPAAPYNVSRDSLDLYDLGAAARVASIFANGTSFGVGDSPPGAGSSSGDSIDAMDAYLALLRLRPAPVVGENGSRYLEVLQTAMHQELQMRGGFDGVLGVLPQGAVSTLVDTLAALEDYNETHGRDVRLVSLSCQYDGYVALANASAVKGGHRYQACADWQYNLATYVTFMASALEQQTGELLFRSLEVSTGRLLVRQNASSAAQRRRAACEHFHFQEGASKGREGLLYPVCNYSAGCGDADNPCNGHGNCTFPSVDAYFAAGGALNPSAGRCVCEDGWHGPQCGSGGFVSTVSGNLHTSRWILIGMAVLVTAFLVALGSWFAYKRISPARRAHAREAKKRRPPKDDEEVAVVFTDIKGSTGLWEWDAAMMSQCIQIHHRVLRALLPKYHGYESNTEGDAFELVFHDAIDALNWVLEAQEALMYPERVLAPLRRPLGAVAGQVSQLDTWPAKLLQHEMGSEKLADDGTVIYRGLRVRMGLHVGRPDASYQHPNGRQRYTGRVVDMAKAIGDAPEDGGQVLLTMNAWHAVGSGTSVKHLVVHNLGEYVLSKDLPPVQVMEVLREGLRKRSPFRPLRCVAQLSPSFYAAPASSSYVTGEPPSEPIIIMFTFIGGLQALKSNAFFGEAVRLLVDFMRAKIYLHRGYECEEKDGNFLITFADPMDAAVFTQDVQAGAMKLPWPDDLLREEAAAEVLLPSAIESNPTLDPSFSDKCVFRGLRLKIGMYMGLPTKCMPHGTTGRAAYFGPIVNRSARIATTAADGQTLCNVTMVQALHSGGYNLESQSLTFSSLGHFPLKGLAETLELFQVSTPRTAVRLFPRTRGSKNSLDRKFSTQISVEQVLSRGGRHSIEESHASGGPPIMQRPRISFSLSPRSGSNSSPNSPTGGAYYGFDMMNRSESLRRIQRPGTRSPSLVQRDGEEGSNLLAHIAEGSSGPKDRAQLHDVLKRPLPFFSAYVYARPGDKEKNGEAGAGAGAKGSRSPSGAGAASPSLPWFVERNLYQELTDLRMEVEEYRVMVTALRAQLSEASELSARGEGGHSLLPGYSSGKGNPPVRIEAPPVTKREDEDTIMPMSPAGRRSILSAGKEPMGSKEMKGDDKGEQAALDAGDDHPLFLARPRRSKPYLVPGAEDPDVRDAS